MAEYSEFKTVRLLFYFKILDHVRAVPGNEDCADCGADSELYLICYALNFEEVGGSYCFWGVRPFVRPSVQYAI